MVQSLKEVIENAEKLGEGKIPQLIKTVIILFGYRYRSAPDRGI